MAPGDYYALDGIMAKFYIERNITMINRYKQHNPHNQGMQRQHHTVTQQDSRPPLQVQQVLFSQSQKVTHVPPDVQP
jgi:hypothetical protein